MRTRDYYSEHTVRGRREYRCGAAGCGGAIAKGEAHVRVAIGSDGRHSAHRMHCACFVVATGREAPARVGVMGEAMALCAAGAASAPV